MSPDIQRHPTSGSENPLPQWASSLSVNILRNFAPQVNQLLNGEDYRELKPGQRRNLLIAYGYAALGKPLRETEAYLGIERRALQAAVNKVEKGGIEDKRPLLEYMKMLVALESDPERRIRVEEYLVKNSKEVSQNPPKFAPGEFAKLVEGGVISPDWQRR